MRETRTLTIAVYRDPDGHPTCRTAAGECKFMMARKFGLVDVCGFVMQDIQRRPHGADRRDMVRDPEKHYLRPVEGCPLWT